MVDKYFTYYRQTGVECVFFSLLCTRISFAPSLSRLCRFVVIVVVVVAIIVIIDGDVSGCARSRFENVKQLTRYQSSHLEISSFCERDEPEWGIEISIYNLLQSSFLKSTVRKNCTFIEEKNSQNETERIINGRIRERERARKSDKAPIAASYMCRYTCTYVRRAVLLAQGW